MGATRCGIVCKPRATVMAAGSLLDRAAVLRPEIDLQQVDVRDVHLHHGAVIAHQLNSLAEALEKRFGRKLNLTVQEDPSLIGGIRVVVGDEVLDTSVKARLEQMKVALTA